MRHLLSGRTALRSGLSTIRALSKSYTGFLYQVRNGSSSMNTGSGGTTKDIGITADGYADTATQDAFCTSTCTFSILYDQSGNGNNLKSAPAGNTSGGTYSNMPDWESSATKGKMTVNGHTVYALYMEHREGAVDPLGLGAGRHPLAHGGQAVPLAGVHVERVDLVTPDGQAVRRARFEVGHARVRPTVGAARRRDLEVVAIPRLVVEEREGAGRPAAESVLGGRVGVPIGRHADILRLPPEPVFMLELPLRTW